MKQNIAIQLPSDHFVFLRFNIKLLVADLIAKAEDLDSSFMLSSITGTPQIKAPFTAIKHLMRIRRVSDNVTVYDTTSSLPDGDENNKTSLTVPTATLDFDTAYSVQVKFKDNADLESAYTAAVNFSTPLVDQPDIQTICEKPALLACIASRERSKIPEARQTQTTKTWRY